MNIFQAGTKIASGSDDLNIIVWEWERGRYIHTHNVKLLFKHLMLGDSAASKKETGQI